MKIGCPKEIKPQEFRVGMTPAAVTEAAFRGHEVVVETGAGLGAGFTDDDYIAAGAGIAADAKSVFDTAQMIVKVKEPQAAERAMLRDGQVLFTYLHLAPDPDQTRDLMDAFAADGAPWAAACPCAAPSSPRRTCAGSASSSTRPTS